METHSEEHTTPLLNQDELKEWRKVRTDQMEAAKKKAEEEGDRAKEIKKRKVRKGVQQFYKHQGELVEGFLTVDTLHDEEKGLTSEDLEREKKEKLRAKIAIYASFITNVTLFVLKMYAAISSRSLAVVASALDSFLDLLSGSIIFLTNYLIKKENPYLYPIGKGRLEPLGIIVFASCMFVATLQLLIQAVQSLVGTPKKADLTYITIAIICFTVFAKLILFAFCRLQKNSPSAIALAQDHRNDVLSNTFGVATALLGFYVRWWIDPTGSIIMSLYIMSNWFRTGFVLVKNLTGKSATPEFLQQLTYLALNHDPRILKIDTVRAFFLGTGYMAEVDIVLPKEMSLKDAHDIGESLQTKLERVAEVERGFVHLDYEYEHSPEHNEGKKLIQLHKDA